MTSSFGGLLVMAFLLTLALAAILMPLYVISMYSQVVQLRKLVEKLLWQAEQQARRDVQRDQRPGR